MHLAAPYKETACPGKERPHEDKTPGSMGRSLHAGSGAIGAGGLRGGRCDPIERMAPLEQYLMPPGSEIALARSAAPAAISEDEATVITLELAGLPDRRPRHQRIHLSRGEVVDGTIQQPRFLESEGQGTGLRPRQRPGRSSRTRSSGRSSHSPETRRKGFSTRFAPRSRATSSPHPSRARCPS